MYPSKKEILSKEIIYRKETIEKTKAWKQVYWSKWKSFSNIEKIVALCSLIHSIARQRSPIQIEPRGKKYCYKTTEKIIEFDVENPSVISALHELAHHLYGPSELQACRWSIGIFSKVFKEDYNKLEFKGHLLRKKT